MNMILNKPLDHHTSSDWLILSSWWSLLGVSETDCFTNGINSGSKQSYFHCVRLAKFPLVASRKCRKLAGQQMFKQIICHFAVTSTALARCWQNYETFLVACCHAWSSSISIFTISESIKAFKLLKLFNFLPSTFHIFRKLLHVLQFPQQMGKI